MVSQSRPWRSIARLYEGRIASVDLDSGAVDPLIETGFGLDIHLTDTCAGGCRRVVSNVAYVKSC